MPRSRSQEVSKTPSKTQRAESAANTTRQAITMMGAAVVPAILKEKPKGNINNKKSNVGHARALQELSHPSLAAAEVGEFSSLRDELETKSVTDLDSVEKTNDTRLSTTVEDGHVPFVRAHPTWTTAKQRQVARSPRDVTIALEAVLNLSDDRVHVRNVQEFFEITKISNIAKTSNTTSSNGYTVLDISICLPHAQHRNLTTVARTFLPSSDTHFLHPDHLERASLEDVVTQDFLSLLDSLSGLVVCRRARPACLALAASLPLALFPAPGCSRSACDRRWRGWRSQTLFTPFLGC